MNFNSFHTREAIIALLKKHGAKTAAEIDGPSVDINTLSKKERKRFYAIEDCLKHLLIIQEKRTYAFIFHFLIYIVS